MAKTDIYWECLDFGQLGSDRLYKILRARAEVFVVEQHIIYLDPDDRDQFAHHVIGWDKGNLVAYLRLIAPGKKYKEPAIGRVLTVQSYRRFGLGKEIMKVALDHANKIYPGQPVRISAQRYLENFYKELGFTVVSEPYIEEDIEHVEMLLSK